MNLLGAVLYDPSSAASKATSSLLAMTAFDTTNLRLTVTVPAHGFLFCRMRCQLEGATTFPQVLLGLLNGASVAARVTPTATLGATALATTRVTLTAEFVIPGLTPGSITLDAAYGVEIVLASTNIKYGGPNDTTTDNAWGAFVFELWDPRALPTAAPGAVSGLLTAPTTANVATVDVLQWKSGVVPAVNVTGVPIVDDKYLLGTIYSTPATAGIQDVNVKNIDNDAASASGTVTFPNATLASTTNITAGTITTVTTVNGLAAGVITATSIAADAITDAKVASDVTIAAVTGAVGSVTGAVGSVTGLTAADVAAIKAKTDGLPSDPADQSLIIAATDAVMARLGAPAGASVSADIAAAAAPSAATVASAVWDTVQASHVTAGTTGKSLSNASAAGDPWSTALPGSYAAGTAGSMLYAAFTLLRRMINR